MRTTIRTDDAARALVVLVTFEAGDVLVKSWDYIKERGISRRWTQRAIDPIRVEVAVPLRQLEYLAERALSNTSRKATAAGMTARITSGKQRTITTYDDDGSTRP